MGLKKDIIHECAWLGLDRYLSGVLLKGMLQFRLGDKFGVSFKSKILGFLEIIKRANQDPLRGIP